MKGQHISLQEAAAVLGNSEHEFVELFQHGSLTIELYRPDKIDKQTPHTRDEVYIIASGNGTFYYDGVRKKFITGDFLFVSAGVEHRFEDFSDDFSTWVMFYGPEGGEQT